MIKRKSVYIAVLNQGVIRAELILMLNDLVEQGKYDLFVSYPSDKPITYNRNKIVQDFLNRGEFDYLMMVDSDIIPPSNILNLVDYDKDIITPVLFAYQGNQILPLAVMERKEDGFFSPVDPKIARGLLEVDANGTGCMIIRRDVLRKVRGPFLNVYDTDGMKKTGQDFAFCRKAKKLGFKVWCHFDYVCSHYTTVDLKEIYGALIK